MSIGLADDDCSVHWAAVSSATQLFVCKGMLVEATDLNNAGISNGLSM